jgi:hypothetical protein
MAEHFPYFGKGRRADPEGADNCVRMPRRDIENWDCSALAALAVTLARQRPTCRSFGHLFVFAAFSDTFARCVAVGNAPLQLEASTSTAPVA